MISLDELFFQACAKWHKGDLDAAYDMFLEAAEKGDGSSQNNLGVFYEYGYSVEKDFDAAIYWYKKAASSGEVSSNSNLASLYLSLDDSAQAIFWYKKAIENGDGDSMVELAEMYAAGDRTMESLRLAKTYFKMALASDDITPDSLSRAQKYLKVHAE